LSRRKKQYQKKPFESTGKSNDVSANIYMSMMLSEAWRALTPAQVKLYLYCKAQLYAEKKKPVLMNGESRNEFFTMNRGKWCNDYELYKDNNREAFHRDMTALIEKGFIECIENGKTRRVKSIYAFSEKWQSWPLKINLAVGVDQQDLLV